MSYEERLAVKKWLHRADKVDNSYDFEAIVDSYCHSTKGLALTNPYMSGILTEYYDVEDWVDVCATNDCSRLKEKKNAPSWVQHVVELSKNCKEGHEVFCFYAWENTPYVYMAKHVIGKCPHSEYKSQVMKKYKVRCAVEIDFEFDSAEDISRVDMVSHIRSVAVDGATEGIIEYLGDYIDIDDPYEDIHIEGEDARLVHFTKNGKGVRK